MTIGPVVNRYDEVRQQFLSTVKNNARVVRRSENVSRHTVCRSRVPTQNRIGHARGCSLYFLEMIGARTAQYAAVVHGGEQIGRHVNR